MRTYYDDYDELDERSFEEFVATRHLIRDKQRHGGKKRGHKRSTRPRVEAWEDHEWDKYVDYDDYNDNEFDSYYDKYQPTY